MKEPEQQHESKDKPPVPKRIKPVVKPRTFQPRYQNEGDHNGEKEGCKVLETKNENKASSQDTIKVDNGRKEINIHPNITSIFGKDRTRVQKPIPVPRLKTNKNGNCEGESNSADTKRLVESPLTGGGSAYKDESVYAKPFNSQSTTSNKSEELNLRKPPPKPPRGVPAKQKFPLPRFLIEDQEEVHVLKGGTLGRYGDHVPPAQWKNKLFHDQSDEDLMRPRALSDMEQETKNPSSVRNPPKPPPQSQKPKKKVETSEVRLERLSLDDRGWDESSSNRNTTDIEENQLVTKETYKEDEALDTNHIYCAIDCVIVDKKIGHKLKKDACAGSKENLDGNKLQQKCCEQNENKLIETMEEILRESSESAPGRVMIDCKLKPMKTPPKPPSLAMKPKIVKTQDSENVTEDYHEVKKPPEDKEKETINLYSMVSSKLFNVKRRKSAKEKPLKAIQEDLNTSNDSGRNNLEASTQSDTSVDKGKDFQRDPVVLRNKPHLRKRREVRHSAPMTPDPVIVKGTWESFSVRRMPSSQGRLQDREPRNKGFLTKFTDQKKKTEPLKQAEESLKVTDKEEAIPGNDLSWFDYVVVVSLRPGKDNEAEPYISFRFPPKLREKDEIDDQIESLPNFCFPDLENESFCDSSDVGTKRGFKTSEIFSFVLTDISGKRSFGYCRHILVKDKPSRGTVKSEVYCIVSPHGLFSLYSQILDEVERQRVYSASAVFSFLKAVLSRPMPRPGSQVEVVFFSTSSEHATDKVTLSRGVDSGIHEHVDIHILFEKLPLKSILNVISCLLLEKRVILAASQLGLLSACCHGFIALLYPFTWLHTYIPVLPNKLVDMCCVPTPYLLGMLSGCLPALEDLPLDEVVILDLDSQNFLRKDESEDSKLFPKDIQENIEKALQPILAKENKDIFTKEDQDTRNRNAYITEVFVQAYIHMIGHFPDFLLKESDSDQVVQKKDFCRAASTKDQKKFLKKFTDTQAFSQLVHEKLNENEAMAGLFANRLVEWRKSKRIDFSHVTSKLRDFFPRFKS